MMRVLTPNGNVIEVEKAEAIVEKRVSFNGMGYQTVSDGKRQKPACQRIVFFGENGVGFYYCK